MGVVSGRASRTLTVTPHPPPVLAPRNPDLPLYGSHPVAPARDVAPVTRRLGRDPFASVEAEPLTLLVLRWWSGARLGR